MAQSAEQPLVESEPQAGPEVADAGSAEVLLGPPGTRLRVRRSVNYVAFLVTGAVLGFIVGVLVELLGPTGGLAGAAAPYTRSSTLAYLGVSGALAGTLIAGVVALLLDRRR